jgi:hypothetical protein
MGCHQTAGFPGVAILPKFSANGGLLKLDGAKQPQTEQSFRMMYYGDVASGVVFSDVQLYSSDYSLQLSMSLQNFISLRCAPKAQEANAPKPPICGQLAQWGAAQRKAIRDLMSFGTPGPTCSVSISRQRATNWPAFRMASNAAGPWILIWPVLRRGATAAST